MLVVKVSMLSTLHQHLLSNHLMFEKNYLHMIGEYEEEASAGGGHSSSHYSSRRISQTRLDLIVCFLLVNEDTKKRIDYLL